MEMISTFECLFITVHDEKQLMDSLSIIQRSSQIPAYLTSIEPPSIQLNLLLAAHSLPHPSQDLDRSLNLLQRYSVLSWSREYHVCALPLPMIPRSEEHTSELQ